ncbi:MAG: metal-dependent hydrolase [Microthrixaceae bacterium]|nr:metal-dependent hydrolase [Microthrixaceae bacterium]
MFLWYLGVSWVAVWSVFRSPALDYRLVMVGSVLPVGELPVGTGPLHTLLAPVLALAVVMLATRHRRLVRRRWLGLPIGMYLHLVLDAVFNMPETFWWPFLGLSFGADTAPEVSRGWWSVVLEVVGIALAVWAWRRFGLDDAERRSRFVHTGQLDRSVVGQEAPGC